MGFGSLPYGGGAFGGASAPEPVVVPLALPLLTLEAAFGVNPGTVPASGDWVDLSGRGAELHPKYGRGSELTNFDRGEMSLVLDNADGYLDPDNSSSPY